MTRRPSQDGPTRKLGPADAVVTVCLSVLGTWLVRGLDTLEPLTKPSLHYLWTQPAFLIAGLLAVAAVIAEVARRHRSGIRVGRRFVIEPTYVRRMELALAVASVSILAVAGYGALTQQSAMASSRTPTPPSRPSTASLETTTPGSLTIYPGMRGFTRGGQQGYWFQSGLGVAGTALYAYANGSTRENWARWTFDLSKDGSGFYNATVFVPSNHATTGNARYLVNTAQGPVTVSVDQKPYYDTWVSLGTYEFDASAAWIQVDDATGEVYADTESPQIGVDAMRLIPVN